MKIIFSSAFLVYSQIISADSSSIRGTNESDLISIQQQEIVAREQIALEQTRIESLKLEIKRVNDEISKASVERYSLLDVDEQGLIACEAELSVINKSLESILASDPATLSTFADQIDGMNRTLDSYREKKVSKLPSISTQLQLCEVALLKVAALIEQSRLLDMQNSTEPLDSITSYSPDVSSLNENSSENQLNIWVVKFEGDKRESLFIIAGYPEVYGNPNKWPLLYEANKEVIDQNYQNYTKNRQKDTDINPQDILFPGQILKIPR